MDNFKNTRNEKITVESRSCSIVIYIVDPDEAHSRVVSALLNRVGYPTEVFESAEALLGGAVKGLNRGCIISEMDLPGMNGLQLLRALQKRKIALPVIILTRDNNVSFAVQAFRDHVADYLVKPFVERDLVNKVRGLLQDEIRSGA